jgi:hypothetical protein
MYIASVEAIGTTYGVLLRQHSDSVTALLQCGKGACNEPPKAYPRAVANEGGNQAR